MATEESVKDKMSIFTLQFADEAAPHTLRDQYNRYINIKFMKSE
jgi:hypothetical protein